MRFLVDNALSPALAILLTESGLDAIHVRTLGLQHAEDAQIFDRAAADDRIVVSADTDFGALLASRTVKKPSVIQFRGPGSRRPEALARAILANLPQIADISKVAVSSRSNHRACGCERYRSAAHGRTDRSTAA